MIAYRLSLIVEQQHREHTHGWFDCCSHLSPSLPQAPYHAQRGHVSITIFTFILILILSSSRLPQNTRQRSCSKHAALSNARASKGRDLGRDGLLAFQEGKGKRAWAGAGPQLRLVARLCSSDGVLLRPNAFDNDSPLGVCSRRSCVQHRGAALATGLC